MATEVLRRQIRHRFLSDKFTKCRFDTHHVRHLTSGEVSTALRPFYFSVHPDLFGKYPTERATNESSLQYLSSYLQNLQQNKQPRPTRLTFYLKPQGVKSDTESLKSVKISLAQPDIKKTIVSILSSCDLPTTYVDNLSSPQYERPKQSPEQVFRAKMRHYEEHTEHRTRNEHNFRKLKKDTLLEWLSENCDTSRKKLEDLKPVKEEVERLRDGLCKELGLSAVLWECGWNVSHFRGCLLAFRALAEHHRDAMRILRGRTLVFGTDTGVSFDGQVLLNIAEVRNNWLDFIKNVVKKQDVALKTVPTFEKTLSRVLRDIQIVRRKFQPHTMAKKYETNLIRMTTSLSDFQGRRGYPKTWPESLAKYELVVETESGPMMVSPTGQFILPCSCPAFLVINFITDNMRAATQLLDKYKMIKQVEKRLIKDCIEVFGLVSLKKDDSISPEVMISCCEQLLKHSEDLNGYLKGIDLKVTNYYSVMLDGQMCIPWNWRIR